MNIPIESWLRKRPRPVSLRLQIGAERRDMPLGAVRSWAAVAESIAAVNADVVEALGPQGEILRVLGAEALDAAEVVTPTSAHSAAAPLARTADPETQRFTTVANLLADAYRHSTEVAFERMVDLFAAVNQRQTSLEKSLDHMSKLLRQALEQQLDNAPPEPQSDLLGDMAKSFMGGLGGAPTAPPNGTNGKHS